MIKQQQRSLWNFRERENFKSYLKKYNDDYVNSSQDTRCFHINYELQKTTKKEQIGMKVNRHDKKEMGEENKDFMYSLKEKSQTGRRVQHSR